MSMPYLGQIEPFPFNITPKNWVACEGQLLAINSYQALFSLLGTTYGGNGTTNFGLPDLRGRVAMGQGSGQGLTPRALGQATGEVNHTLLPNEMPTHNHLASVSTVTANNTHIPGPTVNLAAATLTTSTGTAAMNLYIAQSAGGATTLSANALAFAGGSQPHNNMAPYLALHFCISLTGQYPSRS